MRRAMQGISTNHNPNVPPAKNTNVKTDGVFGGGMLGCRHGDSTSMWHVIKLLWPCARK